MNSTKNLVHRKSGVSKHIEQFGPYKIEALLTEAEEANATVYRVRVEANQTTTSSYHAIAEEFYFVLTGSGMAILDGVSQALEPGDFLRLPPGTKHAFVTLDKPLEMLDIHIPGCRPGRDTYFVEEH